MKKLKYTFCLLFFFILGYILSIYTYPKFINPKLSDLKTEKKTQNETEADQNENEKLQYVVDIPAKYFDPNEFFEYGNTTVLLGVDVILPPVAINESVENINLNNKYV